MAGVFEAIDLKKKFDVPDADTYNLMLRALRSGKGHLVPGLLPWQKKQIVDKFVIQIVDGVELVVGRATNKRVVKQSEAEGILRRFHDDVGHPCRQTVMTTIKNTYHSFPRPYLETYLKNCNVCAGRRSFPKPVVGKPIQAKGVMVRVQADCIDFRSCADGEIRWVLQVKDHFSKFVWLFGMEKKESRMVAKCLRQIFHQFGPPRILQTDNGGEFDGAVKLMLQEFPAVKLINGRPRHPQSQGLVERANQTFERRLGSWIQQHGYAGWSDVVQRLGFEINRSPCRVIAWKTPFEVMFARVARDPVEAELSEDSDLVWEEVFDDEEQNPAQGGPADAPASADGGPAGGPSGTGGSALAPASADGGPAGGPSGTGGSALAPASADGGPAGGTPGTGGSALAPASADGGPAGGPSGTGGSALAPASADGGPAGGTPGTGGSALAPASADGGPAGGTPGTGGSALAPASADGGPAGGTPGTGGSALAPASADGGPAGGTPGTGGSALAPASADGGPAGGTPGTGGSALAPASADGGPAGGPSGTGGSALAPASADGGPAGGTPGTGGSALAPASADGGPAGGPSGTGGSALAPASADGGPAGGTPGTGGSGLASDGAEGVAGPSGLTEMMPPLPTLIYDIDPPRGVAIGIFRLQQTVHGSPVRAFESVFEVTEVIVPSPPTQGPFDEPITVGSIIKWPKKWTTRELGCTNTDVKARLVPFLAYLCDRSKQAHRYQQELAKRPAVGEGDVVAMKIPRTDRANLDPQSMPARVITNNKGYLSLQVGTSTINKRIQAAEVTPWPATSNPPAFPPLDPNSSISLVKAYRTSTAYSQSSKAEKSLCNCKKGCAKQSCGCKKSGLACGTKCHPGIPCTNTEH